MAVSQTNVSECGKRTCHQCRQSRSDVTTCKNAKTGKKLRPCTISFCRKCLINRYGEKVEVVEDIDDWCCPKCRGVCNCSLCMKKRGLQPTGILVQAAKARGFLSVLEMLQNKDSNAANTKQSIKEEERKQSNESCLRENDPDDVRKALLVGHGNKENVSEELKSKSPLKKLKTTFHEYSLKDKNEVVDIAAHLESKHSVGLEAGKKRSITKCMDSCRVLPNGTDLLTVANIDFLEQDVGLALQFLEFCASFTKVLDIKKGQPESILRDLSRGLGRRGLNSALVQFHVKLLSLLYKDEGKRPLSSEGSENTWLLALQKRITESTCSSKMLSLDFVNKGITGYDNLATSKKLRILTFLCDEVLDTEILRSWIDKENLKYIECRKEKRKEIISDKEKERFLKQQMKADVMQMYPPVNDGSHQSLSKHDASLSEKTSKRKSTETIYRSLSFRVKFSVGRRTSDAVRTEAVLLDEIGRLFWRLKGYYNNSSIILQEIASRDSITSQDKWTVYDEDEVKEVDEHISFVRSLRSKRRRNSRKHDLQFFSETTKKNTS